MSTCSAQCVCPTGVQSWRRRWMFCQEQHHSFTPMKRKVSLSALHICRDVFCLPGHTCALWTTTTTMGFIYFFCVGLHVDEVHVLFSAMGTIDAFVKCRLAVSDTHQANKTKHHQLPSALLQKQFTCLCQPAFPGFRVGWFSVLSLPPFHCLLLTSHLCY